MQTDFAQLSLSEPLSKAIAELGYERMTPIQALGIPPLLAGKDLIGQSKTGSGKTAAFSIPALERVETSSRSLQFLVLCPTRELCLQVAREIRKLAKHKKDLRLVTLSGGHPVYLDRKALEHGAQVIVGTPGRLLDHISRKTVDLSTVKMVVLDEADRMLDMGFREKMEEILAKTPAQRQTALFSATYPPTIENLGKRFMKNAERVTVETTAAEAPDIEQLVCRVHEERKTEVLLAFLRARKFESVLVFCNLKVRVDELTESLRRDGHSADKIHGDLEQSTRETVMAKFRNHSTTILVATDVAARGLDVVGLDAVVNYDMPSDPEQYVHRIGRTGRAGMKGVSFSLVMPKESAKLERLREYKDSPVTFLEPAAVVASGEKKGPTPAAMNTLMISAGRKDKLRAGDILGALTKDAGLRGEQVGKIEILDRVSYVAVSREAAREVVGRLRRSKIKGRRFIISPIR